MLVWVLLFFFKYLVLAIAVSCTKPNPCVEMTLNMKKGASQEEHRRTRRVWEWREGLALFTDLSPLLLGVGLAALPVPPCCANTRAMAQHPGLPSPWGHGPALPLGDGGEGGDLLSQLPPVQYACRLNHCIVYQSPHQQILIIE